jgi:hypothetical protein
MHTAPSGLSPLTHQSYSRERIESPSFVPSLLSGLSAPSQRSNSSWVEGTMFSTEDHGASAVPEKECQSPQGWDLVLIARCPVYGPPINGTSCSTASLAFRVSNVPEPPQSSGAS